MPLLKILGHLERETFVAPPIFKTEERKKFFTLPAGLNLARETLRTPINQVFFILQAGYFRDRHRFFENQFRPADIDFVADRCQVSADQISISNYPKQTLLRHQQLIVDYFDRRKLERYSSFRRHDQTQIRDRFTAFQTSELLFQAASLYRALKEFGKIIKTIFILRYIDDPVLRQSIEKQLNKIENAHKIAKAIAFGNNQEFSSGEKEEQDIIAACGQLIENSVICWNYLYLTQKLNDADQKESQELLTAVKEGSIVTWQHINFHGEYDFSEEKLRDSVGLNLPQILSWKRDENQE